MDKNSNNLAKLEKIVNITIDVMQKSKEDLHLIAKDSKTIFAQVEFEYLSAKKRTSLVINELFDLENKVKFHKKNLENIVLNEKDFSKDAIQKAYATSNELRLKLVLKRNEEQMMIKRRNELEVRLKETQLNFNKAEKIINSFTNSIDFFNSDLSNISNQLKEISIGNQMGKKIIMVQEDERQRLARDLHDGPAQLLSNIVIRSEICDKLLDIDKEKAKTEVSQLKNTISDCLNEAKLITYNLSPLTLEELGIHFSLKKYISKFILENNICIEYTITDSIENINSEVSLTIFRIIQETLSNIKKHANATKVTINLYDINNYIILTIVDNGKGSDITKNQFKQSDINSGFGLIGIKERVKILGGQLTINSTIDVGTNFEIHLPLSPK